MKDQFGRNLTYLRISVVDRCNLRCLYCMPVQGTKFDPWNELLSFREMIQIVKCFTDLGVQKIRLTGGEPLVRPHLEELVSNIREIPAVQELALSTNGVLLKGRASILKQAGLDRINISLDTLRQDRFREISKMDRLFDVLDGIDDALSCGLKPVKLNTVLIKGTNDDEIIDLVQFAIGRSIELRFIELMPTNDSLLMDTQKKYYSVQSAKKEIQKKYNLIPADTYFSSPAEVFTIEGTHAKVGFISPISNIFCSRCNRLRLKANGALKTCLHGREDLDLKELLRSGAPMNEIKKRIQQVVWIRPEEHFLNNDQVKHHDFQMSHVGG